MGIEDREFGSSDFCDQIQNKVHSQCVGVGESEALLAQILPVTSYLVSEFSAGRELI